MSLPARQIDRYILRQLVFSLAAVTAALVALIWLTQSIRFVELVVNRGLSLRVFLQLTGLLIPGFIAVILPITTFVVVLFTYQRLAGDRELTVLRSAGLSPWALSRPALVLGCLVTLACLALNIWIVPASFTAFRQFEFQIRNRVAAFLLQEGVFTTISDDLTVYVRTREPDGTLRGIVVDDGRNKAEHVTILARSGRLVGQDGAPRVLLLDGTRQEIDRQTGRLSVLDFAQNTIELTQAAKGEEMRFRDAAEVSIPELLDPPAGLVSERDRPRWRVEAHRRLATPLTALGFAMIGLAPALTGQFRRHGSFLLPTVAVLTVVGLLALGLAGVNLAQRLPSLIPLVWLQAAGPIVAVGWLLYIHGTPALPPRLAPARP